jgi:hypothetical protein
MIRPTDKYQVTWPKNTHFRTLTCQEAECAHFIKGWITKAPIGSAEDDYIKSDRSRKWIAVKADEATIHYFFEAGQKCFRPHRVKAEMAPFFTMNQPGREPARLIRANMDFDEWTTRFNEQSYRNTKGR